MNTRLLADPVRFPRMTTPELRETFLIEDLFAPGEVQATYVDLDRAVVASAVPLTTPLSLPAYPELRADYFLERRELGVLNVGGSGSVTVDGTEHPLDRLDSLYIGQGCRQVEFHSRVATQPAEFYLLSYPAHAIHPTTLIRRSGQPFTPLGAAESCNRRDLTRLIHLDGVQSAQLVMGFTQLAEGSAWNTMPPHTHMRRSEIYLYFDLAPEERIVHLMGPPQETRHLIVANKQAILSPGWSIHAGVGTRRYSFCWGMGGENQAYSDMDPVSIADLR